MQVCHCRWRSPLVWGGGHCPSLFNSTQLHSYSLACFLIHSAHAGLGISRNDIGAFGTKPAIQC
jgi:hypothetical protein